MFLMKIAVLITCYNRVRTTVECLGHLFACKIPDGIELEVWLVDDASPDGTGSMIKEVYPSVNVIQGTGRLYWCGGMRLAWTTASKAKEYDGYLWLNDDTFLHQSALTTMISDYNELRIAAKNEVIVAGCVTDLTETITAYGGHNFEDQLVTADGRQQPLRMIHGNCVYISKQVFQLVGNYPEYFTHAFGDFDYSLRAAKLGIPSYLSSVNVGRCGTNPISIWRISKTPFFKRVKDLYSPKNSPCVLFRFCLAHNGFFYAVKVFIQQHIKVCFPRIK
jgi:GT2 family glycosyltransferase